MDIESLEKRTIMALGAQMGFGRIMQLAQEGWKESLEQSGYPSGGEFAFGPCVSMTVPCGCEDPVECEWCCGSGHLTKRVKLAKTRSEKSQKRREEKKAFFKPFGTKL
jgi:hypothetical protein